MPTAPESLPTLIAMRARRSRSTSRSDLGVPQRQLQAERHRLGVDAVGAADHRRAPVFEGAHATASASAVEVRKDDVAGFAHL